MMFQYSTEVIGKDPFEGRKIVGQGGPSIKTPVAAAKPAAEKPGVFSKIKGLFTKAPKEAPAPTAPVGKRMGGRAVASNPVRRRGRSNVAKGGAAVATPTAAAGVKPMGGKRVPRRAFKAANQVAKSAPIVTAAPMAAPEPVAKAAKNVVAPATADVARKGIGRAGRPVANNPLNRFRRTAKPGVTSTPVPTPKVGRFSRFIPKSKGGKIAAGVAAGAAVVGGTAAVLARRKKKREAAG